MDAQTLGEAMGWSLSLDRYEQLLPAYLKAMQWADITNVNRAAMFAAQLGHESVGLKYQNEIADGSAYEWRSDLGNTQAGDGRRFKGHGWIQITGRANHTAVSKWAYHQGIVPTASFFVDNPTALGNDTYCWVGPAWYWVVARPDINALADARDLTTVTRRINGGTNGLDDRRARYNRCLAMGAALLPEEINMAAKDDIIGFIKAYVGPLISDVKDIREQLTGSRDLVYEDDAKGNRVVDWAASFKGWKQLGQNPDGSNKTVVDSLADARDRIIALEQRVAELEGK